jgi:hypothetical protein
MKQIPNSSLPEPAEAAEKKRALSFTSGIIIAFPSALSASLAKRARAYGLLNKSH